MSLYLVIGITAALLAVIGSNKKLEKSAYAVSFMVLLIFLALRFGQGTDWLSYNYIYSYAPSIIDFGSVFYSDAIHSELGWKLLNNVAKVCGIDFFGFSVIISVLEMVLLARFVNRFSPNRALSLFVAFPVVYLTYFFSAFRQGVVIALFLGVMLDLLIQNRSKLYCVLAILAMTIHSLSIVLFIPLLIRKVQFKTLGTILAVCLICGMVLIPVMPALVSAAGLSYSNNNVSMVAVLYRAVMAFIIYLMYSSGSAKQKSDEVDLMAKTYIAGLSVYCILMGNDLVASRLASPLMAVEIALIPALMKRGNSRMVMPLMMAILVMISVMTIKNIDSYIDQGFYYSSVTPLTYPYINYFNQEDIYLYTANPYLAYLD